jgi:lysophospholipase L1-like esterase
MAKAKKPATSELTYEEVQKIRAALGAGVTEAAQPEAVAKFSREFGPALGGALAAPRVATLVAEGDSWFDYLPGLDIIAQLELRHRYRIINLAQAGDSLENIAFGTEIGRDFSRTPPQLDVLLDTVEQVRPRVVLLSAGGNDIAGEELAGYLNHADSGLPPLRVDYLKDVIHGQFRRGYQTLAQAIWKVDPTIHVVTHGYGHAIPSGVAVLNFPFGFRFIGPWLKPAFVRKNIKLSDAREIVKTMIDEFNSMLAALPGTIGGPFHVVDLRSSIRSSDWVNELHLTNDAYRRVADKFHAVIKPLV